MEWISRRWMTVFIPWTWGLAGRAKPGCPPRPALSASSLRLLIPDRIRFISIEDLLLGAISISTSHDDIREDRCCKAGWLSWLEHGNHNPGVGGSSPSPATIFPHTPRTLLGYACCPSNAFRRPAISIVTPPGREGSRKTVTVSTRPLIASAASESPALIPLDKAS